MKFIIFDLDETLGYFVEFGIFWDCLSFYLNHNNNNNNNNNNDDELYQEYFNKILDLYPEFLRPNIIHILNYLKKKKRNKLL